jgi:transcriptional regulator with XRE-family HTH domain
MKIGLIIRKYRVFSELTQINLANEIGISKSTLSRLESGEEMDGATLGKVLVWLLGKQ